MTLLKSISLSLTQSFGFPRHSQTSRRERQPLMVKDDVYGFTGQEEQFFAIKGKIHIRNKLNPELMAAPQFQTLKEVMETDPEIEFRFSESCPLSDLRLSTPESKKFDNLVYQTQQTAKREYFRMSPSHKVTEAFFHFIYNSVFRFKLNRGTQNLSYSHNIIISNDNDITSIPESDEFKSIRLPKNFVELLKEEFFFGRFLTLVCLPKKEDKKNYELYINPQLFHPLLRHLHTSEHLLGLANQAEKKRVDRGKMFEKTYNFTYENYEEFYKTIKDSIWPNFPYTIGISQRGLELVFMELLPENRNWSDRKYSMLNRYFLRPTISNFKILYANCKKFYNKTVKGEQNNGEQNNPDSTKERTPTRLFLFAFVIPFISAKLLRNLFEYETDERKEEFFEYGKNYYKNKKFFHLIEIEWQKILRWTDKYVFSLKNAPHSEEYNLYRQLCQIEKKVQRGKRLNSFYKLLDDTSNKDNMEINKKIVDKIFTKIQNTQAFERFCKKIEDKSGYFAFFKERYSDTNTPEKQKRIKEEANMRFDAGLEVEGALILSSQIELKSTYPTYRLKQEDLTMLQHNFAAMEEHDT